MTTAKDASNEQMKEEVNKQKELKDLTRLLVTQDQELEYSKIEMGNMIVVTMGFSYLGDPLAIPYNFKVLKLFYRHRKEQFYELFPDYKRCRSNAQILEFYRYMLKEIFHYNILIYNSFPGQKCLLVNSEYYFDKVSSL